MKKLTFSAAAAAHVTLLCVIDLTPDCCVAENFKAKFDLNESDLV
jgi:hypothetical protein